MAIKREQLALGELGKLVEAPEGFDANEELYSGNHWRDGKGWTGPMPAATEGEVYREAATRVERAFVAQNIVREVVQRHLDGVIGQSPRIGVEAMSDEEAEGEVSGGEEQEDTNSASEAREEKAAQVLAALERFWNEKDVRGHLRALIKTFLLSGEAPIRTFIPPEAFQPVFDVAELEAEEAPASESEGEEDEDAGVGLVEIPALTFEEALDAIFLDTPPPSTAGIHKDKHTGKELAVYIYEPEADEDGDKYAMVSYLDGEMQTIQLRIDEEDITVGDPLELGGALLMAEMNGEPLVTEQVRQLQSAHTKALTTANVNVDWGGFLERIFLNAQQPTTTEEVVDRETGQTKEVEVPGSYESGPSKSAYVQGTIIGVDDDGNYILSDPDVKFREPIDPSKFGDTADMFYRSALAETRQLHALLIEKAGTSGEARLQARDDFRNSLKGTKAAVDPIGAWLLQTVYMLARDISSTGGLPAANELQWTFSANIDAGPLTSEEMHVILERVKGGTLSLPSALSLMGVEDVGAELERIESGDMAKLEADKKRAEIAQVFTTAGMSIRNALLAAGYEEERATQLASVGDFTALDQ